MPTLGQRMTRDEEADEIIRRLKGEWDMNDLKYFQKKLIISLKVPIEFIYVDIKV
jgi:hypothetical protein